MLIDLSFLLLLNCVVCGLLVVWFGDSLIVMLMRLCCFVGFSRLKLICVLCCVVLLVLLSSDCDSLLWCVLKKLDSVFV